MTTSFQLTAWERATLVAIINNTRGDAGAMRKCIKLLDVLELTQEERANLNVRNVPTPEGVGLTWDITKEPAEGYFIDFKDGNLLAYMQQLLKGDGLFSGVDARKVIVLIDKLGA